MANDQLRTSGTLQLPGVFSRAGNAIRRGYDRMNSLVGDLFNPNASVTTLNPISISTGNKPQSELDRFLSGNVTPTYQQAGVRSITPQFTGPAYAPSRPASVVSAVAEPGTKEAGLSAFRNRSGATPNPGPILPAADAGFQTKLDPDDPAFIGGQMMKSAQVSAPPFSPVPVTSVDSSDMASAYENPASIPSFLEGGMGNILAGQRGLLDAMRSQPRAEESLTRARTAEGYDVASGRLRDINQRVADFNATISNLENEVRRDLGDGVGESYVQAELNRRTNELAPIANRLNAEREGALANLALISDATNQRLTAVTQDAERKVKEAATVLGFETENLSTATNLMVQMKNFELANDYQQSMRRDNARSMISTLLSSPRGLKAVSDADLQKLSLAAEMPAGVLADIRDNYKQGSEPLFQNVDDAGNLNLLMFNPETGEMETKRYSGFARIIPKTSTTKASGLDAASAEARSLYFAAKSKLGSIISNQSLSPEEERAQMAEVLGLTALKSSEIVTNEAERKLFDDLLSPYESLLPELSSERASGGVRGKISGVEEALE